MNQAPSANQSQRPEYPPGEAGRFYEPTPPKTPEEIEAKLASQNAEILRYYMATHRAKW